jgi:hypothetical protein
MAFLEEEQDTAKLKSNNVFAVDYETRYPHTQ